MIELPIMQLFPDFLLADKNGFAMAKAIEKALQIMCGTVQTGVDTVQNVDKMPELRRTHLMKELYTKPVSEVNEFSQTADVITTSGTDWGFGGND